MAGLPVSEDAAEWLAPLPLSVRVGRQALDQRFDLGAQRRKLAFDDVPHERKVYAKVLVDELVAHPGDLPPRDTRLECTAAIRQTLDGLTDDLDVADDRVLGLAIREEGVAAVGGVVEDRFDCIQYVEQVGAFIPHSGMASE